MTKLKLFIAMSVDGYIAGPNDDLSFLKKVEKAGEDYGYEAFISTIGSIIIGRKTYDYVANNIGTDHYAANNIPIYVITSSPRPPKGVFTFYTDDIVALIHKLKQQGGKDIYCDGGAQLIHALLTNDLIDECTISIIPVLLGKGIRLFGESTPSLDLRLMDCKYYDTGLVQLKYIRKTEKNDG